MKKAIAITVYICFLTAVGIGIGLAARPGRARVIQEPQTSVGDGMRFWMEVEPSSHHGVLFVNGTFHVHSPNIVDQLPVIHIRVSTLDGDQIFDDVVGRVDAKATMHHQDFHIQKSYEMLPGNYIVNLVAFNQNLLDVGASEDGAIAAGATYPVTVK